MDTTGIEVRGKACRDLASRAEVGARMESRGLFWEQGQGLWQEGEEGVSPLLKVTP